MNRAASTLSAAGAANVQSASLRITHNGPNFDCQGTFSFPDTKPVEWTFQLVADEPESTEAERVTLHWDGSALVFTSRSEAKAISFRYELDAEGRLRLAEQLRGTDHDQDNLWVFDRR